MSEFFGALPPARAQLFEQLRGTSYSAADPERLDTVYRQRYLDRITGTERLQLRAMADVVGADMDGAEVVLRLVDRTTGVAEELRFDVVRLGTGFAEEPPALVRAVLAEIGATSLTVDRTYRLALPAPRRTTATCYARGIDERTHGISDSLLKVLATWSADIVADLFDQRARQGRAEHMLAGAHDVGVPGEI